MTALALTLLLALPAHEETRYLMGTVATVRTEAPTAAAAAAACDAAFAELDRLERVLSSWRDDSDLSRFNQAPVDSCVAVHADLLAVLDLALQVARETGGAFDPTVLPLVRTWGLRGGTRRVPTAADLADALARVGHDLVRTDPAVGCARRLAPGVEIDLGGIAKGYALDRARDAARQAGATAGVLDLGGNLLVFGAGRERTVLVASPDGSDDAAHALPLTEGAVATSGQYERFVELDGRRYGHILDPRSGRPVARRGSVTVTASSGWLADALATAAFVLGPEAGEELAAAHPGAALVFLVEDGEGGWDRREFGPRPE